MKKNKEHPHSEFFIARCNRETENNNKTLKLPGGMQKGFTVPKILPL